MLFMHTQPVFAELRIELVQQGKQVESVVT